MGGLLFLLNLLEHLDLPTRLAENPALGRRDLRWCLHRLSLLLTDAEPDDPDNREKNKKRQRNELRVLKGRFGLCGSEVVQCGYSAKGHDDGNKDIEIKCDHRADDIDPAPGAGQVSRITGKDREDQHDE